MTNGAQRKATPIFEVIFVDLQIKIKLSELFSIIEVMTTRSETGGLGDGSESGPEDLTYEYLAEQGMDLRLFLQQALNAEGTDGLRAIAAALDHTRISTASYERVE